jgi:hypothetical protein
LDNFRRLLIRSLKNILKIKKMTKVKLTERVVNSSGNGKCQIHLITDGRQMNGKVLDILEKIDPQVKNYVQTHEYYCPFSISVPSDIELEVIVAEPLAGQELYDVRHGLHLTNPVLDQITCYVRQDFWKTVRENQENETT